MKKVLWTLLAAGAVCACAKTETVVDETIAPPSEITFKTVARNLTKGGEWQPVEEGKRNTLSDAHLIHIAATQRNVDGNVENAELFSGKIFKKNTTTGVWESDPKTYWPVGNVRMDFLAYVIANADKDGTKTGENDIYSSVAWGTSNVAEKVTLESIDTYTNQRDILYAAANRQTSGSSVALAFDHAEALLIFNVGTNVKGLSIKSIEIYSTAGENKTTYLKTTGNLEITNTYTEGSGDAQGTTKVEADWKSLSEGTGEKCAIKSDESLSGKSNANSANNVQGVKKLNEEIPNGGTDQDPHYYQIGETLLIPNQSKLQINVKYSFDSKEYALKYPEKASELSGTWDVGKKYVYNIYFKFNEMTITPQVNEYTDKIDDNTTTETNKTLS